MVESFNHGDPPPIVDGTTTPSNFRAFEQLVQRLYEAGDPSLISSIERHLQWHQRSENGWDIAYALLQSQDANVRFFGALTLVVKLNQDV